MVISKNIASLTVALNEEDLIGGCLELLDMHKLVLISNKTFSGLQVTHFDQTEKIAKEKGADVIFTDGTEPEIRNIGLAHLQSLGYEYALIVDTDEYWPKETQREIERLITEKPAEAYKANMDFYFKKPNWKIEGMVNRRAIVVVRTDKRFNPKKPRYFSGQTEQVNPGNIYHFSYVRSHKKMKEKLESFSHAHEIIKGWYNDVYLPFTPDAKNFHPVKPSEYPQCVVCELPEEIASKIPKHLWLA